MGNGEDQRNTGGLIVGGVLLVLVLIFAILNWDDVKVRLIFVDITLPLFFVIVGSAIFGLIAGAVVRMGRR